MPVYKSKDKTKDGRQWFFSTYYVDLDGINKKKFSKKYSTKKEAQEGERTFLLTYKEQNNSSLTFKDLILAYLEHQKDKVKISTYRKYNPYFAKLKKIENVKLSDFNITHFNLWKNEIDKLDVSTTTKNNYYKVLRALLNYAIKYHNIINLTIILNKMTGFKNPNELKKEMSYWTLEEFSTFINEVEDLKYKCFFEMLYYCGLRKGEANSLNWKDVDFENEIVNINKNITQKIKGEKYIILPPKTKGSNRKLPIPKILLNDLKELKREYQKYKNFSNNWFVFGGILPLADTTVDKLKNEKIEKLDLKYIRIHDLRHSCASLLINNGASISLVAKYLGHTNITTTLNTYTHLFKNELDEIKKTLDNITENSI